MVDEKSMLPEFRSYLSEHIKQLIAENTDPVFDPLLRYGTYIENASKLATLVLSGEIAQLEEMARVVESTGNPEGKTGADALALGKEMEELTHVFFAQSLVGLWSALEASVTDFVVAWLVAYPEHLNAEIFAKIPIEFAKFMQLDQEDRVRSLVKEVEQKKNQQFKSGVKRFEFLLNLIGLRGGLQGVNDRELYELSLLRNVIVHRASIVDKRFVDAWGRKDFAVGQRVVIDNKVWAKYLHAVTTYHATVMERSTRRPGKKGGK